MSAIGKSVDRSGIVDVLTITAVSALLEDSEW
jgi:hypothetical protein